LAVPEDEMGFWNRKDKSIWLPAILLLNGLISCTSSSPVDTRVHTPSVSRTPTSRLVLSASPTPTAPASPSFFEFVPTERLTKAYLVPVEFQDPVVLLDDQFRVTVTGTLQAGGATVATAREPFQIVVPEELRDTYSLLQLELKVEKLADGALGFGSARTDWSVVDKLEDGSFDFPAGWCQDSLQTCAPVYILTIGDDRPYRMFVLFIVPNGAEYIYLYLLGSVPIPTY
jgi:hypothetical protein